jgi:hypothetical protein
VKSPFPSLDPYLEPFWSNVHTRLIAYISDEIQRQLPEGLWSNVEESVSIDDYEDGEQYRAIPDVDIIDEKPWEPTWNQGEEGGIAVAEPLVVVDDEPRTERHVLIVDTRTGNSVVTAIEVISPANKVGERERRKYRRKQRGYLAGGISLVEIDLIRSGAHIVSVPKDRVPATWRDDRLISVCRGYVDPRKWELYPVSLRQPIKPFRIPLRRGDADIVLDLQAVLDRCYENGGYERRIDYSKKPVPEVGESYRDWLDSLLREKELR